MPSSKTYQRFFAELKRRKVFRAAATYGAAAFVVIQVADVVFPAIPLPAWTVSFVVWLCLLGFPFALAGAWIFERDAEGLKRTEAATPREIHAIVSEPAARRWPSGVAALVGMVLMAAGAWAAWQVAVPSDPALSEDRLAVLPFGVTGSANMDWMREGLPQVLSQNLLGPGGTETVDPARVFKLASTGEGTAMEVRAAGDVARGLGAGRFVMGNVQGLGGRVRINAALYALRDSIHTITRGEVEGDTTELFDLVDRLTGLLVGGSVEFGAANRELVRTAANTTASLPALRHYLEGEHRLRDGAIPEARESFQRAVEEDSTFALAMFRNAFAHLVGFANREGEAATWAERATLHAERLAAYDRQALAAFTLHVDGRIPEAEAAYRELMRAYPSRIDGKVLLTMLLAYYEPIRGRSLDEAARHFEELRRMDPGYLCLTCVAGQIYVGREDMESLAREVVATLDATPDSAVGTRDRETARALLAFATGDTAAWQAARSDLLATADPDSIAWANFPGAALFSGRPALADTLATVDLARAEGHEARLMAQLTRGRWDEAAGTLDAMFEELELAEVVNWTTSLPLAMRTPDAKARAERVLRWTGEVSGGAYPPPELAPHLRLLGGAIWLLQAEQREGARMLADSLVRLPVDSTLAPVMRNIARMIRAEAALQQNDLPSARSQLDGYEWQLRPSALSLAYATGMSRALLLRGEVAWQMGEAAEALRWLEQSEAIYQTADFPFMRLRRGQAHEATGDEEKARLYYAQVLEALEAPSAGVPPWREQAQRRLADLMRGTG